MDELLLNQTWHTLCDGNIPPAQCNRAMICREISGNCCNIARHAYCPRLLVEYKRNNVDRGIACRI